MARRQRKKPVAPRRETPDPIQPAVVQTPAAATAAPVPSPAVKPLPEYHIAAVRQDLKKIAWISGLILLGYAALFLLNQQLAWF
jgi:hypothetical protein